MRNYIILNGVNSNTITGLLISTLPPITKPKIRTQTEEIDGRDGDIVTKLGYSAYDKEFEIGLYGDFDINEVIAYFNSEGTVVFSNEEDKYYNYQILDQIDNEKLIRFKTATIRMHVQPFKYPLEEEQIQVDATVVEAEGSNISLQYTSPNHTITSELKGDLYQETTTGKNLLPPLDSGSQNGLTFTTNSNGITTISGTTTGGTNYFKNVNKILPAGTYTLSINLSYTPPANSSQLILQDINNVRLATINLWNITSKTFTLSADTEIKNYYFYSNSGIQHNGTISIQLEKGSTPSDYEEYTGGQPSPSPDYPQEIEVVTGQQEILVEGKNLYDASKSVSGWINANGVIIQDPANLSSDFIKVNTNQEYTISVNTQFANIGYALYDNNKVFISRQNNNNANKVTITIPSNIGYIRVWFNYNGTTTLTPENILDYQPMIEKGSEATDYVVYHSQSYTIDLGTTELYRIPDTTYRDRVYQDNNTWYIERQVGKVILNGSEAWGTMWNDSEKKLHAWEVPISDSMIYPDNLEVINPILCDNFKTYGQTPLYANQGAGKSGIAGRRTTNHIIIENNDITTLTDFKTWLGTHNTIVYYVLAKPTTNEITDTTLLGQLNELAGATTYENTTNISVTGNLPVILKATTSGMPNTVINNIGNIYAKPLITIYGSGTIGVYLNQIQVLQIELGNNGSITIDVSKMEAYNNSTKALMNRLVTGDYMKFLINSGENNIAFSGNVAGFTMDNYTRWL